MHTRNRPNGPWPMPGSLQKKNPKGFRDALKHSCTAVLSVAEIAHFAQCTDHLDIIRPSEWESRGWYQPRGKKEVSLHARCAAVLACGYRCGRPIVRLDVHDLEWFCTGHLVPPLEKPFFLDLTLELREHVYQYVHPLYGLSMGPRVKTRNALLLVNKSIYGEVMKIVYRRKPLKLRLDNDSFEIDQKYLEGKSHEWGTNPSVLFARLLQANALQHISSVEIDFNFSRRKIYHSHLSPEDWRYLRQQNFKRFESATHEHPINFEVKASAAMLKSWRGRTGFVRFLMRFRRIMRVKNTSIDIGCCRSKHHKALLKGARLSSKRVYAVLPKSNKKE